MNQTIQRKLQIACHSDVPQIKRRANVVRLHLEGHGPTRIGRELGMDPSQVLKFVNRFSRDGLRCLYIKKGPKGTSWHTHPPKHILVERIRQLARKGEDLSYAMIQIRNPNLYYAAKRSISPSWTEVLRMCGIPVKAPSKARRYSENDYKSVMALKMKGLLPIVIARKLNLPRDTVQSWVHEDSVVGPLVVYHNQLHILRKNAPLDVNAAYILGVLCGDGYMSIGRKKRLQLEVIDYEFVERFATAVKKRYGIMRPIERRISCKNGKTCNTFRVQYGAKEIAGDLLRFDAPHESKTDTWHVPKPILKGQSKKLRCAFLAGYFDSEGTINRRHGQISVSSNSDIGLSGIKTLLSSIGIHSSIYCRKNGVKLQNKVLAFSNSESRRIYADNIGFTIPRKQDTLNKFARIARF
jgi:hypothetical protein